MIQPDEIIRSDRKTLSISVDPFGRLIVRAPKHCGEGRIFAFLQEKENWIIRQQRQRQGAGMRLPPENLHGYEMLLLGEKWKLLLADSKKIVCHADERILYLPRKDARKKLLAWLKTNAKRIFTELTAQTAARMGVAYRSVMVTSARGRWGSCSYNDAVHYSFRLLYAPKRVIEYVVTHELAHTKHKNHSASFWREVEGYQPDWREKRAWLKQNAALMYIF